MARYSVTVKRTGTVHGVYLEAGMNVEVVTNSFANPIYSADGKRLIAEAFERKYGVDMELANALNSVKLDCEKI